MQLGGDADAVEQLGGLGFGVPAVQLGELALQLCGALAVFIGEILLGIEGVLFLHDLVQTLVAHDDGVHHGEFIVLKMVLLQHAHAVFLAHGNSTGGGLQLTGDDAQQSGFARAVGADDTVAVVGLEQQVNVLVEQVAGKLKADVVKLKHDGLLFVCYFAGVPPLHPAKGSALGSRQRDFIPLESRFCAQFMGAGACIQAIFAP